MLIILKLDDEVNKFNERSGGAFDCKSTNFLKFASRSEFSDKWGSFPENLLLGATFGGVSLHQDANIPEF